MRYVLYDKAKDGILTKATGKNNFGTRKHAEKWAGENSVIKEVGNVAKKKRSKKQLANDRRLGRMAKARAKAKRGGARKKKTRKKVRRKANPKRTTRAKSHLWLVFKCKNSQVGFLAFDGKGKTVFKTDKGKAILFQTKKDAEFAVQSAKILRGWNLGICSADSTPAEIRRLCGGK